MEADKYPVKNTEMVLDELDSMTVFNMFSMFARYWEVGLAEQVQVRTTHRC